MLAQEEGVGLGAGQPGAVDAGLLTRAHAHGLPVIGEAHGVGLGVFQGDERHDQVDFGGFGQVFIFGDDVLKQMPVDFEVVPPLLEGDAEDLLRLLLGGNVVGVDGHHVVAALALGFQDGQRFLCVAGGNHAVGDLPGDELCGGGVAHVGQGDPVAEGAHPVGASCPGVGAGEGAVVQLGNVVHEARLFQVLGQHLSHGGGSGGDVLEGRDGDHARGLLQFLHKLP